MIMRVPSRGSILSLIGASSVPTRKFGSRTSADTPIDPIGNSSAAANASSVAATPRQRGRSGAQVPDPWKSPAAFASRFSAVEGSASSENTHTRGHSMPWNDCRSPSLDRGTRNTPIREHSMRSTDDRSPSLDRGKRSSSCGEPDSEQQAAAAAAAAALLPNSASNVSTVDVATMLVGFASVKGGSAEGTPSQSSLDLGELGGVGEQLVDVMQRFAPSDRSAPSDQPGTPQPKPAFCFYWQELFSS